MLSCHLPLSLFVSLSLSVRVTSVGADADADAGVSSSSSSFSLSFISSLHSDLLGHLTGVGVSRVLHREKKREKRPVKSWEI